MLLPEGIWPPRLSRVGGRRMTEKIFDGFDMLKLFILLKLGKLFMLVEILMVMETSLLLSMLETPGPLSMPT